MKALVAGRSILGGIAAAIFLFVTFHRLDLAIGDPFRAVPLGFMTLWAGWGLGGWLLERMNISRMRSRTFGGVMVAVASGLVVFPLTADVFQISLFGMAGSCAVALLWKRSFAMSARSVRAFIGGFVIGTLALAGGLAGHFGLHPLMMAGCGPGAFLGLIAPGYVENQADGGSDELHRHVRLSCLFFHVSSVLLIAALIRVYSYGSGWMAFGMADLGLAFGAGFLLRHLLPERQKSAPGSCIAQGLGLLGVALLVGWSFVFHPYLVFSEPATIQSSPVFLTAARTFPLWGLAFVMAFLVPTMPGRPDVSGGRLTLLAILALAAVFVMPAGAAIYWNYLLAGFFALCGVLAGCAMAWRESTNRVEKVFPSVSMCLGIAGLVWMMCVGQMGQWHPLRFSFAWYQQEIGARFNAPQPPKLQPGQPAGARVSRCDLSGSGLKARVQLRRETGTFRNGELVWSSRSQDSASIAVMVGMLPATADKTDRVAALTPLLRPTHEALRAFVPGAQLVRVSPRSLLGGAGWISSPSLDAMIIGPGAMSGANSSGIVINMELLENARRWLGSGGVLATWLPTRTLEVSEFENAIQTIRTVFPNTVMFTVRDEIVLVSQATRGAGSQREEKGEWKGNIIDYGTVRALFQRSESDSLLSAAGYWDPRLFIGEMSAGTVGVRKLGRSGSRISVWRPTRGMVLARDLARRSNPVLLSLIVQHRLHWKDKLVGVLEFTGRNARRVALKGLKNMYEVGTREMLEWVGEACRKGVGSEDRVDRLVEILRGSRGRLEWLAPETEQEKLRVPVALYRFGLYARAMTELSRLKKGEEDRFGLQYWKGRCLEKLGRGPDALRAYRRARDIKGENVPVLLHMAGIELNRRRFRQARRHLKKVIELDPENVRALVRLSFVNGQMGDYKRAASLAERALELDPDNAAARDQRVLYRWRENR